MRVRSLAHAHTAHAHRHSAVGGGDDGDLVGKDSSVESVRSSRIPLQPPSPGASAIPPDEPGPRGCGGMGGRPQCWAASCRAPQLLVPDSERSVSRAGPGPPEPSVPTRTGSPSCLGGSPPGPPQAAECSRLRPESWQDSLPFLPPKSASGSQRVSVLY